MDRERAADGSVQLTRPVRRFTSHSTASFSQCSLRWAIETGVDRILFSTDYPYVFEGGGWARAFLEQSDLNVEDRNKIAHGNWERLRARRSPAITSRKEDER